MYCSRSKPTATAGRLCAEEIEHVLDVGALFVEIGRIVPGRAAAGGLGFRRHTLDRQHAIDVPRQIVAGQLDLQVRQTVEGDPLASVSGRPSPMRVETSASVKGSRAPMR